MKMPKKLREVAFFSTHPTTKIGCLIVLDPAKFGEIIELGRGTNQLPLGITSHPGRLQKPDIDTWVQHAEAQAIAFAARRGRMIDGATMLLNWFPCATCAGLIINAGIAKLICDRKVKEERFNDPPYYFAIAEEMLREARVVIEYFDEEDPA
jgi:dCMP deaminase